jgi:Tfp pilus assembly protein FimT
MGERVVTNAPVVTGVCTVLAGFTLNDLAVVVGIVVTLATFGANIWFQWDKRQREVNQMKG